MLVALVIGCGDGDDDNASACTPVEGGKSRTYVTAEGEDAGLARDAICERINRLHFTGVGVAAEGDRVVITANEDFPDQNVAWLTLRYDLRMYDWEPNGFPLGTPPVPQSGLFVATEFASHQEASIDNDDQPDDEVNNASGPRFYLFGPGEGAKREPIAPGDDIGNWITNWYPSCEAIANDFQRRAAATGPTHPGKESACREELEALGESGPPKGSTVIEVPTGVRVVRAPFDAQPGDIDQPIIWYVIEDDSELSGSDISDPRAETDRTTNESTVTFEFTDHGDKVFEQVTNRIAQRGALTGTPNNFAFTVDDSIESLASVDPIAYPSGIQGSNGAQVFSLPDQDVAEKAATVLGSPPLRATLMLVEATG